MKNGGNDRRMAGNEGGMAASSTMARQRNGQRMWHGSRKQRSQYRQSNKHLMVMT